MRAAALALGLAVLLLAVPAAAQHGAGHGTPAGHGSLVVQHVPEASAEGHEVHVNWWNIRPRPGEGQPFLASLFNFLVLGLILGRFAYPPLREFVAGRHQAVKTEIDEARRLRAEAAAKLAEYEAKLKDIDHDIAQLLQTIRADAEAEKLRIVAAAEEQAARLRRDAELTVAQDLTRFRREIEQEAVTAAIAAAERILAERMTDSDQRALVERYLQGLTGEAGRPSAKPRGAA
ncbi:MAG TPA: ATP synthase F0 subunit B [Polyangia bacterium]